MVKSVHNWFVNSKNLATNSRIKPFTVANERPSWGSHWNFFDNEVNIFSGTSPSSLSFTFQYCLIPFLTVKNNVVCNELNLSLTEPRISLGLYQIVNLPKLGYLFILGDLPYVVRAKTSASYSEDISHLTNNSCLNFGYRWVISFTPRSPYLKERTHGTHGTWGCVGPRANQDAWEKEKSLSPIHKRSQITTCWIPEFLPEQGKI